jgi:hypothetical protein
MATYFVATTEAAALAALSTPPSGEETLRSTIAPQSEAFTELAGLLEGEDVDPAEAAVQRVSVDDGDAVENLVQLSPRLRDTIADLDQEVLQSVAVPWSQSDARAGVDADLVEFLTDLQHLCRNAVAVGGGVYVVDSL